MRSKTPAESKDPYTLSVLCSAARHPPVHSELADRIHAITHLLPPSRHDTMSANERLAHGEQ